MARLRVSESVQSSRAESLANSLYRDPSMPPPRQPDQRNSTGTQQRLSVSPGSSSDKENRPSVARTKSVSMAPLGAQSMRSPKRRRLGDRDDAVQYESSSASSGSEEEGDASDNVEVVEDHATATADQTSQYDPHQPMQERRELRKSMRAMDKDLQDRRNELSAPDSKELEVMIKRQNVHFGGVKQTSDATIDSRFLVNAGEITYKRTKSLNVGENAQTVDVEEFIGKCIVHMKDAAERDVGATQRRRRAAAADDDDEEDMEQGDALDWSFFGAQACMPVNVRPPVIGFLLGPLSVQKRARAPRVRRERLQRAGPVETVYAKEMRAEELGQYGTSSLTAICTRIRAQFHQAHSDALDFMNEFWEGRDEEEQLSAADRTLMEQRNALMGDGGLSLFKFAINPHDFGQTVENLFYISFLIRDDAIQIKLDADGLPSMHAVDEELRNADNPRKRGPKHQAIWAIDHQIWEDLIEHHNIAKPLIPHRAPDPATTNVGTTGWYG